MRALLAALLIVLMITLAGVLVRNDLGWPLVGLAAGWAVEGVFLLATVQLLYRGRSGGYRG